MFFKLGVLKNFAIFTENHLFWSLFLTLLKKRLQRRCFHVNIAKFLRIPFLKNRVTAFLCCYLRTSFPLNDIDECLLQILDFMILYVDYIMISYLRIFYILYYNFIQKWKILILHLGAFCV